MFVSYLQISCQIQIGIAIVGKFKKDLLIVRALNHQSNNNKPELVGALIGIERQKETTDLFYNRFAYLMGPQHAKKTVHSFETLT